MLPAIPRPGIGQMNQVGLAFRFNTSEEQGAKQ